MVSLGVRRALDHEPQSIEPLFQRYAHCRIGKFDLDFHSGRFRILTKKAPVVSDGVYVAAHSADLSRQLSQRPGTVGQPDRKFEKCAIANLLTTQNRYEKAIVDVPAG